MTTGFIIPATRLIYKIASELKEKNMIERPEVFNFVKTSHAKENMADDPDWFYIRAASILRKLYFRGTVGTQRLRKIYSSPKNRGVRPQKSTKASGKIIRNILQQFEKAGLVTKTEHSGRKLTPMGIKFVDQIADSLKKEFPEISHY